MDPRVLLALLPACSLTVNAPKQDAMVRECTDHYAAPIVDTALFAATATTTIALATREDAYDCNAIGCLGLPLAVAALIVLPIVAVHGFDTVHRCRADQAYVARTEVAQRRAADRRQAWTLTKQAAALARAGQCEVVRQRSPVVRDLDAEFHSAVFARDVAIASCLRSDHIGP